MRGRRLAAVSVAVGLAVGGCWASHEGPAAPSPPPPPLPPPRPAPDAAVPCEQPGAEACGCLGGLRRCDGCEAACPPGTECVERLAVCVPAVLLDHVCTVQVAGEVVGPTAGCGGDGTRACAGDPGDTLGLADPMRGVCVPWAYCAEVSAQGPPLSEQVVCRASSGERVAGMPPVDCPGARLEGVATCGPWCPRPSCARGVCVGVSAERGYGLCAIDYCEPVEQDPERRREELRRCAEEAGEPCACLQPRGEVGVAGRQPSSFAVPARACEAYRRRYPDSVRCTDARGAPLP